VALRSEPSRIDLALGAWYSGRSVTYAIWTLIIAGVCWLGVGVWRARKLAKSLRNLDLKSVEIWLRRLHASRERGAYLIFEAMDGSKRFIQFRREVAAAGGHGEPRKFEQRLIRDEHQ
jgi:hypothetical protein